ncbi:cytochrome o ubiquinol oxidase operon protein cyoD [Nitrosomonas sp. Nm51]|uniref:cytochrome o ubiquinol oxidase subunit IV n=1 Tax=Nitrosomonas sp. Nm51 TaxID=133720 RepID=UPI0008AC9F13|nr:cytochrome o ubiquinol oxidase subunit IV [Nitrosomonas sp. Nm51]SEQ90824.1 cytochrome o ubiquinol oxidase operon protein cyoD [Nitrosomonas sp. Nm51]
MNDLDYRRELRDYLIGFGLAFTLTVGPFAIVAWGGLDRPTLLIFLGACALVQITVHFRFFLHIDLSRQKREDLQLILFSVLLLIIMAIGTIWIMGNLAMRM